MREDCFFARRYMAQASQVCIAKQRLQKKQTNKKHFSTEKTLSGNNHELWNPTLYWKAGKPIIRHRAKYREHGTP